jgi:5-methylcytosine-specific restriction protein A
MPTAPPRACLVAGCPGYAVVRGRCREHARGMYQQREQQRGTATQRGYDATWRRVRAQVLARDRWQCVLCASRGHITIAEECDHILPLVDGGTHAPDNLRALCRACHQERHAQDRRGSRW